MKFLILKECTLLTLTVVGLCSASCSPTKTIKRHSNANSLRRTSYDARGQKSIVHCKAFKGKVILPGRTGGRIVQLSALSRDAKIAAVLLESSSTIDLWSVHKEMLLHRIPISGDVSALALSAFDSTLGVGYDDGRVGYCKIPCSSGLTHYSAHKMPVTSLAFSSVGRSAISSSMDFSIKVFNLNGRNTMYIHTDAKFTVYDIDVSLSGRYLAAASGDGYVYIYDLKLRKLVKKYGKGKGSYYSAAIVKEPSDGFYAAHSSGFVHLFSTTGRRATLSATRNMRVLNVSYNRKSSHLFAISRSGMVCIINTSTKKTIAVIEGKYLQSITKERNGFVMIDGGAFDSKMGRYRRIVK